MGLKGYRLWVMGQLDSKRAEPHHAVGGHGRHPVVGDDDHVGGVPRSFAED